jgi:hypothetical protein
MPCRIDPGYDEPGLAGTRLYGRRWKRQFLETNMVDGARKSGKAQPKSSGGKPDEGKAGGGEIEWSRLLERDPSTERQNKTPQDPRPGGKRPNP